MFTVCQVENVNSAVFLPSSSGALRAPQPLNPNPDSRWNNYFKDNEVLLQIDKDVR